MREEFLPAEYAEFLKRQLELYRAKSFLLLVRYPDNFQKLGNMTNGDFLTTVYEMLLHDVIDSHHARGYNIHPKALDSMEKRFHDVMRGFSEYCMQVLSIPEALQKK